MKAIQFISVAAAALALAACSNDEPGAAANSPVELRLTSGVEVNESRAAANTHDGQLLKGEIILVWVDDAGLNQALYKPNFYVADGDGGLGDYVVSGQSFTRPMYFPQTGYDVNIYAIAGNTAVGSIAENMDASYQCEMPSEINTSSGLVSSFDLLYAAQRGVKRNGNPTTQNLHFYHMLSKLEIAVKVGKGNPELKDIYIENVVKEATFTPSKTVDMTDAEARGQMIQAKIDKSEFKMIEDITTCPDFTDANIVYNEAIVIPQDMSEKVMVFNLKNGGKLKYTIPRNTVFESGKKYRYHVTLNLTDLQVSSSIEPWDDTEPAGGNATMDDDDDNVD